MKNYAILKTTSRIIIAILIAMLAVGIFSHLRTGDIYTGNSSTTEFGDNEYEELQNGNVTIDASSGYTFSMSKETQDVEIDNDESNQYDKQVTFYLGDGTKLYESDYIEPGNSVSGIRLSNVPKQGVYKNALVVYKFYQTNGSHDLVGQCDFPITIEFVE